MDEPPEAEVVEEEGEDGEAEAGARGEEAARGDEPEAGPQGGEPGEAGGLLCGGIWNNVTLHQPRLSFVVCFCSFGYLGRDVRNGEAEEVPRRYAQGAEQVGVQEGEGRGCGVGRRMGR